MVVGILDPDDLTISAEIVPLARANDVHHRATTGVKWRHRSTDHVTFWWEPPSRAWKKAVEHWLQSKGFMPGQHMGVGEASRQGLI